jgi:hypothetical protein
MLPARSGNQTGELAHALFVRASQEYLVWSRKDVNARKGNRLPHETGLKLLTIPRAEGVAGDGAHL